MDRILQQKTTLQRNGVDLNKLWALVNNSVLILVHYLDLLSIIFQLRKYVLDTHYHHPVPFTLKLSSTAVRTEHSFSF